MRYVSLRGLEEFLGLEADEWFKEHQKDAATLLRSCESRLLDYILPNIPRCPEQVSAFQRAVYTQFRHETCDKNKQLAEIPDGVKSFTVNGFSATFGDKGIGDSVSPSGLCREAKAELLMAGLLYRGVGCTC